MAVNPENILRLAEDIKSRSISPKALEEVCYRSSASRAYYSVFHKARILADEILPNYTMQEATHSHLESKLKSASVHNVFVLDQENISKVKSLSYMLKAIKTLRVKADYHTDLDFTENDCLTTLQQAEKFFEKVNDINTAKL